MARLNESGDLTRTLLRVARSGRFFGKPKKAITATSTQIALAIIIASDTPFVIETSTMASRRKAAADF